MIHQSIRVRNPCLVCDSGVRHDRRRGWVILFFSFKVTCNGLKSVLFIMFLLTHLVIHFFPLLRTITAFKYSNCWPLGFCMGWLGRFLSSFLPTAMASYASWVSNIAINYKWVNKMRFRLNSLNLRINILHNRSQGTKRKKLPCLCESSQMELDGKEEEHVSSFGNQEA